MTELTPRQAAFVAEFLVDLNGTNAAIRAGYSARSAASSASVLLKNPKVRAAVEAAKKARTERTEVSADRVVRELARVAFGDLASAYNAQGRLLGVHEMPPEARALLAGVDVEEGEGASVVRKVKTWPKVQALELLGRHLGMFRDKVEVTGQDGKALSVLVDLGAKK